MMIKSPIPWRAIARALVQWWVPQPQMWGNIWWLEKRFWEDSECAVSAVASMSFSPRSCFTLLFHCVSFLTTLLWPGVVGVCFKVSGCYFMPWWLLFEISGILAGGIPGFRIELCCFCTLWSGPLWVCGWLFLVISMGLRQHGTQVVICMRRDDTKLSPLASTDLFSPINWNPSRHGFAVVFLFVFCVGCFFVCFCFWCCFCFWVFCLFRFVFP